MQTLTADSEVIAQALRNPHEKALFYTMRTFSTKTVLRVLNLSLKAERLSAPTTAAVMTLRGEIAKPYIEQRSGPSMSSAEAGTFLGVSDETIRARVKSGLLIGYRDTSEKARLRLPEWQFSGPRTVHPWVAPVINVFGDNGWGLIDFLTVPRRGNVAGVTFDGQSLLQGLQAGNVDLVMAAAKQANPA